MGVSTESAGPGPSHDSGYDGNVNVVVSSSETCYDVRFEDHSLCSRRRRNILRLDQRRFIDRAKDKLKDGKCNNGKHKG